MEASPRAGWFYGGDIYRYDGHILATIEGRLRVKVFFLNDSRVIGIGEDDELFCR